MSKVSLSKAWDESKAILARDGRLLIAVALALIVFPMTIVGLVVPADPAARETSHSILQLVVALIGIVGQLALIRLAIGPATTVGAAISHGAKRFPAMLGSILLLILVFVLILIPLSLLFGAAGAVDLTNPDQPMTGSSAALLLVLIVAAVAVSAKFILSSAVASAERAGPLTILKRSWSLSNGSYWKLLGFVILLIIVAMLLVGAAGAIGGILGLLVSPNLDPLSLGALIAALFTAVGQGAFSIVTSLMVARIYVQLAGRDISEPEVTVPNSGT